MRMLKRMSGVTRKQKIRNEPIKKKLELRSDTN